MSVTVTKRTTLIASDGIPHGRFYEPGDVVTGDVAAIVLRSGWGEESLIAPSGGPAAPSLAAGSAAAESPATNTKRKARGPAPENK